MSGINPEHRQHAHQVRLEWGPTGAQALAPADIAVVVDVLSFTTTLTVAVEQGIEVYPFRWKDDRAAAYAVEHDATLAVQRQDAAPDRPSLSPASLQHADGVRRLVLPSPNGSTISALLAGTGATVVGASLRNRSAVADWLRPRLEKGATIAVVPAGERWPDDTLRPAVEDLWGAGAVVDALAPADASPEAQTAGSAFAAARLPDALAACASGRELVVRGFVDDVAIAAAVDSSFVVPVLRGGAYRDAVSPDR